MAAFSKDLLSSWRWLWGCLSTFCCYDCDTNICEVVEKIATHQKHYHKSSLVLIVCCISQSTSSITIRGWLLGHHPRDQKTAETVQKNGKKLAHDEVHPQ